MHRPSHVLITGASSGIGAALAQHYAPTAQRLALAGRDTVRLEEVAQCCRREGADVTTASFDVTDADATRDWVLRCDEAMPVDLVIANAGISAGSGIHGETPQQAQRIFDVNVGGVLHTILPLLPHMIARKSGQIAIMSSLAGVRGLPSAPAYSASKAAVKAYGEALRGYACAHGVKVSVVMPGYIRTPLTASNPFYMPLLMEADKAARIIANGLAHNRARVAFPLALYLPLWLLGCLSPVLTDPFFSRLPAKPASLGGS